ncbi:S-methyl-5-thioribose kinase [Tepidibacillus infernus]|uniref:S-methyl-5-thioribose kinase n=1 Tax=Tepidibacillus decaturensis TaxID=1413211 RepID=A0A135L6J6_9BACI|nr:MULTISPECIES: S-methyl-5-thioribose kinase [Tepidibacillus]KXG44596.1 5-methylthioribose kinase [Tepidibacillus decaturensis]GBF11869.1 methylthioribose kinase [Tepidibacillus sp. HK-1]
MSKFNTYFLMKPTDVIEYVKEKLDLFEPEADLDCKEIGDGNLNYVFRVWDKNTNQSVIVKQAGETARISDDFKLSTDRNKIESDVLQLEGKLAPGLVPVVYKYDEIMNCSAMEDLSDHVIMRQALIEHKKFPLFADHVTTFMVNTLLLTTDVVLEHKEKKALVKNYINPDLCEITEDLVYTEPFNDYKGRNDVFPPNLEWVRRELYEDQELRLEVAKLKFEFMTNAQALLHGDLHTGSIFIKPDSTKVIDPEFAFYGPIGYDVGNVIANLIFAWVNADATINDVAEREDYTVWLEKTIVDIVNMFNEKFLKAWEENVSEVLAKEEGFDKWYLGTVLRDTAAVTGLELSRRIVGLAHVKDITSISDKNARLRAERICLTAAKDYIKKRESFKTGEDFLATLREAVNRFPR